MNVVTGRTTNNQYHKIFKHEYISYQCRRSESRPKVFEGRLKYVVCGGPRSYNKIYISKYPDKVKYHPDVHTSRQVMHSSTRTAWSLKTPSISVRVLDWVFKMTLLSYCTTTGPGQRWS